MKFTVNKSDITEAVGNIQRAVSTTTARIGSGNWAGGEPYQGFRISYPGGNSGLLLITIDGISEDFPLANKDEIVSNGDLIIRSNGISEYSGGASGPAGYFV